MKCRAQCQLFCSFRLVNMNNIREVINDLYLKGDWKSALEVQNKSVNDYNLILWIKPSLEDLQFITNAVESRSLKLLISVGCGSGFLEWLIQSATGLEVRGIETDPNWWTSSYITVYIPHIYQEDQMLSQVLQVTDSVIMFCYFNNGPAFKDYLLKFKGDCLIIIGPKSNRHTNPHPFNISYGADEWTLKENKQIEDTDDYIAVYDRINK